MKINVYIKTKGSSFAYTAIISAIAFQTANRVRPVCLAAGNEGILKSL